MNEFTNAEVTGAERRGLDRTLFPMRLWEKAKAHGIWNPTAIDLTADAANWATLPGNVRHAIVRLCAAFRAGEHAVAGDLMPLIRAVGAEGRIEEEIYLTSFLFDEARHVDVLERFFEEVCPDLAESERRPDPVYQRIFDEELRPALARLWVDRSPEAQVRASVTYHLIVEGVLAETGYYVFREVLTRANVMPGMREAMVLLQRDESRHIAYGLYFLSRLIAEHGDRAYNAFIQRIDQLTPLLNQATNCLASSLEAIDETFTARELAGISIQTFVRRVQRVAKARTQPHLQLNAIAAFDAEESSHRQANPTPR